MGVYNMEYEMREILFRGLRKNGEWAIGHYAFFPATESHIIIEPFKNGNGSVHEYDVDPETVGQFTGLLDKNGVEIYENDIIEWKEHNIIFKVEWSQEDCGYVCHRDFPMSCGSMNQMYLDHFVIIGNIHQNPELLKDKS